MLSVYVVFGNKIFENFLSILVSSSGIEKCS